MIDTKKLKETRRAERINQKDMARLLNVASVTYEKYEEGTRSIPRHIIQKCEKILHVAEGFFEADGNGDSNLLSGFSNLSDEDKKMILEFIQRLSNDK